MSAPSALTARLYAGGRDVEAWGRLSTTGVCWYSYPSHDHPGCRFVRTFYDCDLEQPDGCSTWDACFVEEQELHHLVDRAIQPHAARAWNAMEPRWFDPSRDAGRCWAQAGPEMKVRVLAADVPALLADLVAIWPNPVDHGKPTTLYRFHDAAGQLLYIGIAGNPGRRFDQHADDKPWWHDIATCSMEHHPNRDLASWAEVNAIRLERPLHNRTHNRTPR